MDVATSRGAPASTAIGPELRFALPNAVLGTDIQRVLDAHTTRLRIFFLAAF